ncbi:MAG TPA: hypothetical protein VMQ17_10935 [Candidatus Sulfotelmatobacter sp.]|jgi:hypothetical protein|nr:hypothetical protein [Candidatus Sulfotelmatobacter sp.]
MATLLSLSESVGDNLTVLKAKHEIASAWERYRESTIKHFNDGIEFGCACRQWQIKYKAQGSRSGKGFEQLLEQLGIPKTSAYRWIRRYEVRQGLRANRNEVKMNATRRDKKGPTALRRVDDRTSFVFFLTEQQRQQFWQDVDMLGGQEEVVAMFLEFVSRKAFEKRASLAPSQKAGPCREGARRTVVA